MDSDDSLIDLLRAARRGELDRDTVERWCDRLGLSDDQVEALVERGLPRLQRWRDRLRELRGGD